MSMPISTIFKEMTRRTAGIRRPGAASLDLAYVACGRLDGFWEFGLSPWDMAAGALLITEAGGLVGDLAGESNYLATGNIIGGTPKVFSQILQVIAPHRSPAAGRLQSAIRPRVCAPPTLATYQSIASRNPSPMRWLGS